MSNPLQPERCIQTDHWSHVIVFLFSASLFAPLCQRFSPVVLIWSGNTCQGTVSAVLELEFIGWTLMGKRLRFQSRVRPLSSFCHLQKQTQQILFRSAGTPQPAEGTGTTANTNYEVNRTAATDGKPTSWRALFTSSLFLSFCKSAAKFVRACVYRYCVS